MKQVFAQEQKTVSDRHVPLIQNRHDNVDVVHSFCLNRSLQTSNQPGLPYLQPSQYHAHRTP